MPRIGTKNGNSPVRKRSSNPSPDMRTKRPVFEFAPENVAPQIRGLYRRVASQLGVDPSYVSRVARSERKSNAVANALERELEKIMKDIQKRARGPVRKTAQATRAKNASRKRRT